MYEAYHAGQPIPRRGVYELDSALRQRVQAFLEVFDLEADVVDALAPALYEPRDPAVGVGGLNELELRSTDSDKGGPDSLVFDVLHLRLARPEHLSVEGEGVLYVVDCDADVVDVSGFAGGCLGICAQCGVLRVRLAFSRPEGCGR